MARLKGVSDEEASFVTRSVFRAAAKKTGKVPDPLRIMQQRRDVGGRRLRDGLGTRPQRPSGDSRSPGGSGSGGAPSN